MARRARTVFVDLPHHITQRGNYRQTVFASDTDREQYQHWLRHYAEKYALEVWAYCLMSNHVHLIAVPHREDSLARALSAAHMRYAQIANQRRGQVGHLWQGRFFSCPMDEPHLIQAARYVERNPVRAGLVRRPEDWRWSSARAHLLGEADPLLNSARWPPADLRAQWADLLSEPELPETAAAIRRQTHRGRPLGDASFVERLERMAGRMLRPRPRGRPKREEGAHR